MFHKQTIKILGTFALLMAFTGQMAAAAKNGTNSPVQNASISATVPQDIVLVIDTSSSMAYETRPSASGGNPYNYDADASGQISENPEVCNVSVDHPCQPMQGVKVAALEFLDTLDFEYDRVGIIALTGQETDGSAKRHPVEVLPLTSDKTTVESAINNLKVFTPRRCDNVYDLATALPGVCILMTPNFAGVACELLQEQDTSGIFDPSSCPHSNIGGALRLAGKTLSGPDPRLGSNWVTVALLSGPANSTDTPENYPASEPGGVPAAFPNGYCPASTYYVANGPIGTWPFEPYPYKYCTDGYPTIRHDTSATANFTYHGSTQEISIYDPDDYARDRADALAILLDANDGSIYTIGIGEEIQDTSRVAPGEPPMAETLLKYIAEEAGGTSVQHGAYYYAPTFSSLQAIFQVIGSNLGGFIPYTHTRTETSTLTKTSTATSTVTKTNTPTATATVPTSTPTNTSTPTITSTPVIMSTTLLSEPSSDGWILESSETSNNGGTMDSSATTIRVGDDASNRQYRGILSFDTSSIPANAVITSAELKFKYAGSTGTLPFGTHGNLFVDIRSGAFRNNPTLQLNDFAAPSSKDKVLVYTQTMTNNWFTRSFNATDLSYIGHTPTLQFRLRFSKDDNNDLGTDFLKVYGGNAAAANRPQLVIQYYVISPTITPTLTATPTITLTRTATPTITPTRTAITVTQTIRPPD